MTFSFTKPTATSSRASVRLTLYRNRRRIRGPRGQRLLRLRGERLERPFAHLYETGRMRRVHLRGHTNILKRLMIHTGGFNLGLLMRHLIGVGTPRGLQGRLVATVGALLRLIRVLWRSAPRHWPSQRLFQHVSVSRSRDAPSLKSPRRRQLSPRAAKPSLCPTSYALCPTYQLTPPSRVPRRRTTLLSPPAWCCAPARDPFDR